MPDWGKRCYHCGSEKHSRPECEAFNKMMAEANKGITDKKKWRPPAGYKSAIAKARDALKDKQNSGKGALRD